jgi:hypothetical protein
MPDLKVQAEEQVVNSTPSAISNATYVRIVSTESANFVLIKIRDAANNVLGSFTLGPSESAFGIEYIIKSPTDTIESNTAGTTIYATSIGFY